MRKYSRRGLLGAGQKPTRGGSNPPSPFYYLPYLARWSAVKTPHHGGTGWIMQMARRMLAQLGASALQAVNFDHINSSHSGSVV